MGALVAAINKKNENVVPNVVAMLREMVHRGTDAHGISTPDLVIVSKSIKEMFDEKVESITALGHNLSRIHMRDRPQPVLGQNFSLVFEGHLFPPSNKSEVDEILEMLDSQKADYLIKKLNGSYAFAIAYPNELIAGRDTMGTTPLYYGKNEITCAIASERKALWALGIKNVKSFPPGNLAKIDAQGFLFKPIKTIVRHYPQSLEMEIATKRLRELLLKSMRERVLDFEKVAVAFSGGLDSSVVAMLANKCGTNTHLISVGLEGQLEVQYAEAAAKALGLPLHVQTYTPMDVERVFPKVLWLIEEPDAMKVAIAIPIYWAAEFASKLGYKVLLIGQGSDELFGGYRRYLKEYAQSGASTVQDSMYHDVALSYEKNFQRDSMVCSFHKIELRLPFVDPEVVHFSLSLPLSLKIDSITDPLRKMVLRRVAQSLNMPPFIVNKTKKAIQYSTGVDKALRRMARARGLTLRSMLMEVFLGLYPDVEL